MSGERPEEPVGGRRFVDALVEQVVVALRVGAEEEPKRRAPTIVPPGREPAARRLPASVGPAHLGPASPARGRAPMNVTSCATASGAGTTSGFGDEDELAARRRGLVHVRGERQRSRVPSTRVGEDLPRAAHVLDHDQLVHLAEAAGTSRRPARHGRCETTIPETSESSSRYTSSVRCAVAPAEALRPHDAGGGPAIALLDRAAHGVAEPVAFGEQGGVARNLAQRASGAATTGVPLAIASTTGSPKPSYRDGRITHAACA